MILRKVSHVEIGDDNCTIKLHHPDGYVTGMLLEPMQPFPVAESTVVIEVGRIVYQAEDGSTHIAWQHAPGLSQWQAAGQAIATKLFDALLRRRLGLRILQSQALEKLLADIKHRGLEITQLHVQIWWDSARDRHQRAQQSVANQRQGDGETNSQ